MNYKDINTEHLYETYRTLKFNYELHSKMMKYKQSGGNRKKRCKCRKESLPIVPGPTPDPIPDPKPGPTPDPVTVTMPERITFEGVTSFENTPLGYNTSIHIPQYIDLSYEDTIRPNYPDTYKYKVSGLSWNIMNRSYGPNEAPHKNFLNIVESDEEYIKRKDIQVGQIVALIGHRMSIDYVDKDNPDDFSDFGSMDGTNIDHRVYENVNQINSRNELDFMLLQETDFVYFAPDIANKLYTELDDIGWGMMASPPEVDMRTTDKDPPNLQSCYNNVCILFNKNKWEPIAETYISCVIPLQYGMCMGFKFKYPVPKYLVKDAPTRELIDNMNYRSILLTSLCSNYLDDDPVNIQHAVSMVQNWALNYKEKITFIDKNGDEKTLIKNLSPVTIFGVSTPFPRKLNLPGLMNNIEKPTSFYIGEDDKVMTTVKDIMGPPGAKDIALANNGFMVGPHRFSSGELPKYAVKIANLGEIVSKDGKLAEFKLISPKYISDLEFTDFELKSENVEVNLGTDSAPRMSTRKRLLPWWDPEHRQNIYTKIWEPIANSYMKK